MNDTNPQLPEDMVWFPGHSTIQTGSYVIQYKPNIDKFIVLRGVRFYNSSLVGTDVGFIGYTQADLAKIFNEQKELKMKSNTNLDMYYVARITSNGDARFSIEPQLHTSQDSAKKECERLAQQHVGTEFGYFKFIAKCKSSSVVWSN